MITIDQFRRIMTLSGNRAAIFVQPLSDALDEFEITTPVHSPAFIAHLAHESGEFRYMREIANGAAYEGRVDLGNTEPGDGKRFPGRGPMQITGRKNTRLCSVALFGDERLLDTPELLEQPVDGCRAAAWFWRVGAGLNLGSAARAYGIPVGCDLNDYAGDLKATTLAINGGLNGWQERVNYFNRARSVLT